MALHKTILYYSFLGYSGKKEPSMDIDAFLQTLIKEFLQLWKGVDAFDAYTRTHFKLLGARHWTINDFPPYANLSR